jgi:plastocyanin
VGRLLRTAILAATASVFAPSPAAAGVQTLVFRSAAITVPGYGVAQDNTLAPSPTVDGYVTAMTADVVDERGASIPITTVMLHHVVFAKLGTPDSTCSRFVTYDGTALTVPVERFYGEGEEREALALPGGYGYPNRGTDRWGLVYMLMNHKPASKRVFVQWTVRYVPGAALAPVRPYWLDVANCRADPIFDVPGTGPLFSAYSRTANLRMPESGRIVAAGGHLHGGGLRLELSNESCGTHLFTSRPTWGLPLVKPVMHEPGPKHMSTFATTKGLPVAAGDRLRLTAVYDNSLPHARAMGIMLVYLAPGPATPCAEVPALPPDPLSHPSAPPRIVLPLARQPVGPVQRVISSWVTDFAYRAQRVVVARGATFRWRFAGPSLHNVTLASGPVGFSSPSLIQGSFARRFTVRGTYRLFCSLHPTQMTQTLVVR